jgi:hypothetical protein
MAWMEPRLNRIGRRIPGARGDCTEGHPRTGGLKVVKGRDEVISTPEVPISNDVA